MVKRGRARRWPRRSGSISARFNGACWLSRPRAERDLPGARGPNAGFWRPRLNSRHRCCSRAHCIWFKLARVMSRTDVDIEREYGPFSADGSVHGVTFDGERVWFASGDKLQALDPQSGKLTRAFEVA